MSYFVCLPPFSSRIFRLHWENDLKMALINLLQKYAKNGGKQTNYAPENFFFGKYEKNPKKLGY